MPPAISEQPKAGGSERQQKESQEKSAAILAGKPEETPNTARAKRRTCRRSL